MSRRPSCRWLSHLGRQRMIGFSRWHGKKTALQPSLEPQIGGGAFIHGSKCPRLDRLTLTVWYFQEATHGRLERSGDSIDDSVSPDLCGMRARNQQKGLPASTSIDLFIPQLEYRGTDWGACYRGSFGYRVGFLAKWWRNIFLLDRTG